MTCPPKARSSDTTWPFPPPCRRCSSSVGRTRRHAGIRLLYRFPCGVPAPSPSPLPKNLFLYLSRLFLLDPCRGRQVVLEHNGVAVPQQGDDGGGDAADEQPEGDAEGGAAEAWAAHRGLVQVEGPKEEGHARDEEVAAQEVGGQGCEIATSVVLRVDDGGRGPGRRRQEHAGEREAAGDEDVGREEPEDEARRRRRLDGDKPGARRRRREREG